MRCSFGSCIYHEQTVWQGVVAVATVQLLELAVFIIIESRSCTRSGSKVENRGVAKRLMMGGAIYGEASL